MGFYEPDSLLLPQGCRFLRLVLDLLGPRELQQHRAGALPIMREVCMNALTRKCRELHIKPADAMDVLQLAGIVSDESVNTEDVAGDDVPRAVEFISHEANR